MTGSGVRGSRPPYARLRSIGVVRAVGVIVLATALLLAALDSARAGTYVMRNCDVPGYGNALIGPWFAPSDPYPTIDLADNCATGGGVGITVAGQMPGGGGLSIVLKKPTEGPQSQIRIIKAVLWYAARLVSSGQPIFFGSVENHVDGTFQPGISNDPPGSENLVAEQLFSPNMTEYLMGIKCGQGGVVSPEPCVPAASVPLLVRGMEVTLGEDTQPVVSQPGGTLLDGGPLSGVRTLTYAASDPQSGIAKVEVLVDDAVVASQDLATRCGSSDFTVCPASDTGTLQIDMRTVPDGTHRLTLRVQDAAGNERLVHANPIEVANAPTLGSSTSGVYRLTARFKGTSRSTLSVPYGRRVSLYGLVTQGSQPVPAGTPIEILERLDRRGC